MSNPFKNCTEVTPQCPIEATTYGYAPNLPSNIILAAIFGLCALGQATLTLRFRIWGFGIAATIGCAGECLGYIGRIALHYNVWDRTAFSVQLVALIVAPSFLAAAIYLTLKHMVLYFGAQYSRLKPVLYVWIFVCADVACILLQAAGGGVAASNKDAETTQTGNDMIIAGLSIQVIVMFVCFLLALDFALNIWKGRVVRSRYQAVVEEAPKTTVKNFRLYVFCTCLAFLTIFIRSVYRVPEFAGGWGGEAMRNELDFMLLDGMMVAIATCVMTVAHPGIFFPAMSSKHRSRAHGEVELSSKQVHESV